MAVKLTCDFRDDVAYLSFGGQRWGPVKTVVCEIGDGAEVVGIDVDEVANRVLGLDFGHHARSLFRWLYERSPETAELVLDLIYEPTADVVRVVLLSDEDGSPVAWSQAMCDRGRWQLRFGMKEGRGVVELVMPAAGSQLPPEVIGTAARVEGHGPEQSR
jgi:hypothetical protein